jgi:methylenetetrahydrofolate dehydrogenase (NADP+)/methenyltetrahydrofolate cyclohydrolase
LKQARRAKAGIHSRRIGLPATTTTAELVEALAALSRDPGAHGILPQHPVGEQIDEQIDERAAFEAIAPSKDIGGVTMGSFGAMSLGRPGFVSRTPGGITRLLDAYDFDLPGSGPVTWPVLRR